MNIICKLFKHNWSKYCYWDDKLKVNIYCPVCLRCGTANRKAIKMDIERYEKTACPKCGAWICTSGICVYCGGFDKYNPDMR